MTSHPPHDSYTEWAVPPALAPYLVCAWRDRGTGPRGPVLPDACIDLLWDGAALHVAGPDTGPAPVEAARDIIGLRFRPGVAPAFLGVAAHELRDRRAPLADLWRGAARDLAEQLVTHADTIARRADQTAPFAISGAPAMASGDWERSRPASTTRSAPIVPCAIPRNGTLFAMRHSSSDPTAPLADALLARLPGLAPPDPLIADLHRALRATPTRIDRYAARLAISERTLHRRALDALGYGPKTLARIVRFRRALALGRAGLSPSRVALAAGYADQAHLTRECRRLAGTTPAALFADRALIVSDGG